jgi:hypothetical protein
MVSAKRGTAISIPLAQAVVGHCPAPAWFACATVRTTLQPLADLSQDLSTCAPVAGALKAGLPRNLPRAAPCEAENMR